MSSLNALIAAERRRLQDNLIERGEVPACMQLCPARARHYGDLDDPESAVSQAIAGREYDQLNVEAGTGPNIYYLK